MSPYKNPGLLASFSSAGRGLKHGLGGRNLRIQFVLGVVVLALAYYLPLTTTERHTIILLTAFVIGAELLNTAIEELADVLIQEHHPGVARVKELAAAGVLVISIASAVIGGCIFLPYL
jgi:diacylglycerol kinase